MKYIIDNHDFAKEFRKLVDNSDEYNNILDNKISSLTEQDIILLLYKEDTIEIKTFLNKFLRYLDHNSTEDQIYIKKIKLLLSYLNK